MIQFKENAQTDGRTDERADRPYFIGPSRLPLGVQKQKTKKDNNTILQKNCDSNIIAEIN